MLQVDDPVLLRAEIARLKRVIDEQEEEMIQLREALRPPEWYPPVELGLTKQEARIIASLYKAKGEVVTKEHLFYSLYYDCIDKPEPKIVDVFVCKARKKMEQYGLEIKTSWGRGYYFDQTSVTIIRDWGIDTNEKVEA